MCQGWMLREGFIFPWWFVIAAFTSHVWPFSGWKGTHGGAVERWGGYGTSVTKLSSLANWFFGLCTLELKKLPWVERFILFNSKIMRWSPSIKDPPFPRVRTFPLERLPRLAVGDTLVYPSQQRSALYKAHVLLTVGVVLIEGNCC